MFSLTYNPGVSVGEKSGLVLFVVLVLLVLGIFIGIKIYRDFDPQPWEYAENKSISGWLILPAIGLTFTPIRLLYDFFSIGYLDKALWVNASNMALTEAIAFELVYNVLLFAFSLLLILLYYTRRTSIPRLMTIFYVINLVAMLIDTTLTKDGFNLENRQLIQAVVAGAIWIPYFNISERVKSTFCKTRKYIEPKPKKTLSPIIQPIPPRSNS